MNAMRDNFMLRPDVIFFNHGSYGACPRPVFEAYQSWQAELEHQPVEFMQKRLNNLMHEARKAMGDYVGADADDLVYVSNATTGINIVARSLLLEPGDEVLSTDHEYGGIISTWQFACQKRGARYVQQTIPLPITSTEQVVDAVWSGVTPRTRVLTLSHITAPTALILPVEKLVDRAREAGITTVIDGAHAPGQIPLDMRTIGADFYVGNCHKWMMAPKSAGFLYAHRERHCLLEPLVGGRRGADVRPSCLVGEHQYQGTRDPSATLSVSAAIQFMKEHDWPTVRKECHDRLQYARNAISEITGLAPITPNGDTWFSQMGVLPIPPCNVVELRRRLHDEYRIEIPGTGWKDRQFLRLSVQGYNSQSDIDTLIEGVATILPDVRR